MYLLNIVENVGRPLLFTLLRMKHTYSTRNGVSEIHLILWLIYLDREKDKKISCNGKRQSEVLVRKIYKLKSKCLENSVLRLRQI